MLSRSNSTAADRLRRAKSTSSAHTTSSSGHHQRTSTSIDPFVVRQHAETAALEAFHRARENEQPTSRPVPPKLRRRRSQTNGKAAGSHFEDARLGRQKSVPRKEDTSGAVRASRSQIRVSEAPQDEGSEGEVVITRKRSVIPPPASSSGARYSLHGPPTGRSERSERRTSQAEYTDGSPAPRNTVASGRASGIEGPHMEYPALRDQSCFNAVSEGHVAHSLADTQTEALPLAPNYYSRGSHSKKLKERKSFILAPFQRRRRTNFQNHVRDSYDTTLPPFNYADENSLPPPPPPPIYASPAFTVNHEKKSRTFSDSLKGRFKKVFCKAPRAPTVLPAQHVEASHLHYPVTTPLSTPTVRLEEQVDPFTVGARDTGSHLAVPEAKSIVESRHSSGEQSAAKSRVTSWTNSTVAGTWSTRDDVDDQDTADEEGRLKRTESKSTLRKARSFFGRPVKKKLWRASRFELRESGESTGLYSALQERIQPADSASQAAINDVGSQSARLTSALDSLPSRQRAESTISSRGEGGGWQASTIRSVTPDPTAYRLDIPSPVAEVKSPDAVRPRSRQEETNDDSTPKNQLHRRPAMKAPMPSKELIERRIERCKNRWQSPLDELSPSVPRPTRHAMKENPYELRSLSRTLHQPLSTDLPHHTRIGANDNHSSNRHDVLSPSVYSRAADESPRPDTPAVQQGGMIVTITGREVKSYAISPSKTEQPADRPIHASNEWRRWLSDEMNGWDGSSAPQDFVLPKSMFKDSQADSIDAMVERQPSSRSRVFSGQRVSSTSSTPEPAPTQMKAKDRPCRRQPCSRLPSYMNERYPMIDTGRNLSEQSVGKRSRVSSRGSDWRPGTAGSNTRSGTAGSRPTMSAGEQEREGSTESKSLKSALARQRVDTKGENITQLQPGTPQDANNVRDCKKAMAEDAAAPLVETTTIKPKDAQSSQSKRHKSAFDLHARYKSSNHTTSRPLEVRRKAQIMPATDSHPGNVTPPYRNNLFLEDSTILNIAAGPYASTSPIQPSHHHNIYTDREKEKENIHPASEPAASLPALSSSEWLAAGTSNAGRKRDLGAIHPPLSDWSSVSKFSPAADGGSETSKPTPGLGPVGSGRGGSPGQRLASSWLDGKRGKDGSPAFL